MATKNKLEDLTNLLFEAIECIADAESKEEIDFTVKKGKTISSLASNVIDIANLSLQAEKLKLDYDVQGPLIPQLESKNE